MFYPNNPSFWHSGVDGAAPTPWYGTDTPDGDAQPWISCAVGTPYVERNAAGTYAKLWLKVKDDGTQDDWVAGGAGYGVVAETVALADFTDGGAAIGSVSLAHQIPEGAYVLRTVLTNVVGFAGNVSATVQIGDGTDVDRYSTGVPSVFASVDALDVGAPSGTAVHVDAKTPVVTVTASADWGAVTAGQMTVKIFYLM